MWTTELTEVVTIVLPNFKLNWILWFVGIIEHDRRHSLISYQ